MRMQMEKMMRESEKRIMDKLASSLEASEARILAAIGSGAANNSAAAKSPAASYVPTMTPSAPSVMRQSAPVADEAKPAPVVRSRTTSAPKKMPSASLGNDGEVKDVLGNCTKHFHSQVLDHYGLQGQK